MEVKTGANRMSWIGHVMLGGAIVFSGLSCGVDDPEEPKNPNRNLSVAFSLVDSNRAIPSTDDIAINSKVAIRLRFSKAMVKQGQVGKPGVAVTMSPEVKTVSLWEKPDTMLVKVDGPMTRSTKYTLTVPEKTVAIDGHQLPEAASTEFSTRLMKAYAYMGERRNASLKATVDLRFYSKVAWNDVAQHCRYTKEEGGTTIGVERVGKPGKDVKEFNEPQSSYTVAPKSDLVKDSAWKFACDKALSPAGGNLGMRDELAMKFRTYGPFKFVKLDPKGDIAPDDSQSLRLAFTTPVKDASKIQITPALKGFPNNCHPRSYNPPSLACDVDLTPQTNYQIKIAADYSDRFGQTLGKEQVIDFRTVDAVPSLSMTSGYIVAELKRPVLPLWSRNVANIKVNIAKATEANFHKLRKKVDWWNRKPANFKKTGIRVVKKSVKTMGTKNEWGQRPLDLGKLTGGKRGPGMYYVEVGTDSVDDWQFRKDGRQKVLVNFTDIGVVSKLSGASGVVWATSLSTGKPLAGARVSVRDSNGKRRWSGVTNAKGIAKLPGLAKLRGKKNNNEQRWRHDPLRIFVSKGRDFTMVDGLRPGGLAAWNFNVSQSTSQKAVQLRGFMHTDRGLYKPTETVHVKGLARETRLGSPLAQPRSKKVEVTVKDPRGRLIKTVTTKLSKYGGFWVDVPLAGDARLGDYTILAKLDSGVFTSRFAVEEFRPATFETTFESGAKQVVAGGSIKTSVLAKYLYGAPMRDGGVDVTVHSRPRLVSFAGYRGYQFGTLESRRNYDNTQSLITELDSELNSDGRANLNVDVDEDEVTQDSDLIIRASVTSPSNEVISKSKVIPYFKSQRYFGIKSEGWFIPVKKRHKIRLVSLKPNGQPASGPATLTVMKRNWNCVYENWGYRGSYRCNKKNTVVKKQTINFSGKPVEHTLLLKSGGDHVITLENQADKKSATASMRVHAWGDGGGSWQSTDGQTFEMAADKEEYHAGDTARLALKTNLNDATGLVTIERDGVVETKLIKVTKTQKQIEIPIKAKFAPNVYVSVSLMQGRSGKGSRGKPVMKMGMLNLNVRPKHNRLKVAVTTVKKDYRPGEEVVAKVQVTDHKGRPVASELALTAADEGVLSLIGFKTPDPVKAFYAPWGLGVTSATQVGYVQDIPSPNLKRPATGGDSGPGSVRARFLASAVWKPGIVTDEQGKATVRFKAPDNLTAFRVMAVAADSGTRFGNGQKRFTVSKPLQVHRYLPRFLTIGDEVKAGVTVHNETGAAGMATVKIESLSGVNIRGAKTRTIRLAKDAQVPVLFDMTALEAKQADFTFSVKMGNERDAAKFTLPVHHPSPERTDGVAFGKATGDKSISFQLPPSAIPGSAVLRMSIDPHGLSGVEQGLRELVGYPYGCLEQTTSKVVPMIGVKGLVQQLNIDGFSNAEIDKYVNAGIAKIGRHQTDNGGFSLWPGSDPMPYYTAYALWGLSIAKEAGYRVDETRIKDGLRYLRRVGARRVTSVPVDNHFGDLGAQAFSLNLRANLGDKDNQAAIKLANKSKDLPIYGKAFLAQALAKGLGNNNKQAKRLVREIAAEAGKSRGSLIKEPHKLPYYMSSNLRTTAIVLDTLVKLDPKNKEIAPLVGTLMKERRRRRSFDTQSNIYSLLALTNYADAQSGKMPSVVAEIDGKQFMTAKLTRKQQFAFAEVPIPAGKGTLKIKPSSELHYNVQVAYNEKPSMIRPAANGIAVKREFFDENGKPQKAFKVGDVVKVRLTVEIDKGVSHLMVSDRIPAGFEVLNTRFKTVSNAAASSKRRWDGYGRFREIRTERVDFANEYNWGGKVIREYAMRAIASGKFALPPTTAELMYEPETNARTGLSYVRIDGK